MGGETDVWLKILDRLRSREMPPKGEPAPDATQLESVIDWVRTELGRVGKDDSGEMAYPAKGNYLDHRLLFGLRPSKAAPATPARIWRISPYQYDEMMTRLIPPEPYKKIPAPIGLTTDHGFRDYPFRYTVGAAETQQMLLNARQLLTRVVRLDPRKNPVANLAKLKDPANDAQMRTVVDWLFEEIVRPVHPRRTKGLAMQPSWPRASSVSGNEQGAIQGLVRDLRPSRSRLSLWSWARVRATSTGGSLLAHARAGVRPHGWRLTDRPPDAQLAEDRL